MHPLLPAMDPLRTDSPSLVTKRAKVERKSMKSLDFYNLSLISFGIVTVVELLRGPHSWNQKRQPRKHYIGCWESMVLTGLAWSLEARRLFVMITCRIGFTSDIYVQWSATFEIFMNIH